MIMFDYRGIAHSTSTSERFSYDLFSDDAIGLLDSLGLERASRDAVDHSYKVKS